MSQQFVNFFVTKAAHMMKHTDTGHQHDKNKPHKYIVRVCEWIGGNVVIIEEEFPNEKKWKEFVNSLGQCDCHIKVYDRDDHIIFDEKRGSAIQNDPCYA